MIMTTKKNTQQQPRDYNAEMSALIEDSLDTPSDIVPTLLAADIVAYLTHSDPALLNQWMQIHAEHILTREIRGRLSQRRAKSNTGANRFADAANEYEEDGDPAKFVSVFDVRYRVDTKNTQRRLGDLDADDCDFIAHDYKDRAENLLLKHRLFELLAQKLRESGASCLSDIYTEEQISAMYAGITGSTP